MDQNIRRATVPNRLVIVLAALAWGCSGAQRAGEVAAEAVDAPPPPPDPPLQILELLPPGAAAAALVDVGQIRQSRFHGQVIEVVRRWGKTRGWEARLQLDLSRDVERLLLSIEHEAGQGPQDIGAVLHTSEVSSFAMIFETVAQQGSPEVGCRHSEFIQAETQVVDGPRERCHIKRCGAVVSLVCAAQDPPALVPAAPSPGTAQEQLAALVASSTPKAASAVIGPALTSQSTCRGQPVNLAGWQRLSLSLGDGAELDSLFLVRQQGDAPRLEQCIASSLRGAGSFPLLQTFGLGNLFRRAQVTTENIDGSPAVRLRWGVAGRELELILSILSGIGGAGQ